MKYNHILNTADFYSLSDTQRDEFMRYNDMKYPNKQNETTYTVKDIEKLTIVEESMTKSELKSKYNLVPSDMIQQNKYVVSVLFDQETYKSKLKEYQTESARRSAIFENYLMESNGVDLKLHSVIYSKATNDASGGWTEIQNNYIDYSEFADKIVAALKQ